MTRALIWFVAILLAAFSPLRSGTVYVPIVGDIPTEDPLITIKMQVLLTNTDEDVPAGFTAEFFSSNTDGTLRDPEAVPVLAPILPGVTALFEILVADIPTGLLEIAVDPQIITKARLVVSQQSGATTTISLPVISSENAFEENTFAHLQGLERTLDGDTTTTVSIINLGHESAECRVRVFRANGSQIMGTAVLPFQPLSQRVFFDAFEILQELEITEGRLEVSCDQPFYTFAGVTNAPLLSTRIITPSQAGTSTLTVPGQGPEVVEFNIDGRFLNATVGDSQREFELPLEADVGYQKINIEFDMFLNRWQSDLFHSVLGLRRQGGPLYFGLLLRGSNQKTIVDLGNGEELKVNGGWRETTNYHVTVEYDTALQQVVIQAFRNGNLSESISGPIAHTDLRDNGNPVKIIFGQRKVADGAYFPPWGWEFSNLKITLTPSAP